MSGFNDIEAMEKRGRELLNDGKLLAMVVFDGEFLPFFMLNILLHLYFCYVLVFGHVVATLYSCVGHNTYIL